MKSLLKTLLLRGDRVYVSEGILTIEPRSGLPVDSLWLSKHQPRLVNDIAMLTGHICLQYQTYSAGKYRVNGNKYQGGVTLRFSLLPSHQPAYAIFNVSIDRERNTKSGKAGTPLPAGQFHPPCHGAFMAFWRRCGLPVRHGRLTELHKRMGLIKKLILTGAPASECSGVETRLNASTLTPLNCTYESLTEAMYGDNTSTYQGQPRDNLVTTLGDKQTQPAQYSSALQANSATYDADCVSGNQGSAITRKPVTAQSTEEWLHEYDTVSDWDDVGQLSSLR